MADTFDLKTKVERAVYALILGTGTGTADNTYPCAATPDGRTLPNSTIDAGESFEESDEQHGNFRFPGGRIIFRDEGVRQPNDSNPQGPFLRAQQRVSAIITQLVQSDDGHSMDYTRRQLNSWGRLLATTGDAQAQTNNQDMLDFTLIYWRIIDYGSAKKPDGVTYYEREIGFECIACNSNID